MTKYGLKKGGIFGKHFISNIFPEKKKKQSTKSKSSLMARCGSYRHKRYIRKF